MKKALIGVSPMQLGALRMIITALFLLLIGFKRLHKIQRKQWRYIAYTAFLGTFLPGFLFAYAVQVIDSAIVAILNSFTPFNTLVFGALFFGFAFKKQQFIGILIGLAGTLILILEGAVLNPDQNYWFALLIIIASVGYAFNVNIVKKHLQDIDALAITIGNFLLLLLPAIIVLACTDFFTEFKASETGIEALGYVSILSIVGTGIAKTIFNKLVQISNPVFSSSVTYLIPIVAILWGVFDNEKLSWVQFLAGFVILFGVYLVNKKK